jgi:hypothetical protein
MGRMRKVLVRYTGCYRKDALSQIPGVLPCYIFQNPNPERSQVRYQVNKIYFGIGQASETTGFSNHCNHHASTPSIVCSVYTSHKPVGISDRHLRHYSVEIARLGPCIFFGAPCIP